MNWHHHPEARDLLAAEYALGTLKGGARRRFETVMREQALVAQAVARWDTRLSPLAGELPPMKADDALWRRIKERVNPAPEASAGSSTPNRAIARPSPTPPRAVSAARHWWHSVFAPIPAGALSLGLMLGIATPAIFQVLQNERQAAQLPESYVGVLATDTGQQGLIVSSLRRGQTVDLKVIREVPVPTGSVLFLWTIDPGGQLKPVGALPPLATGGFASLPLARPAEDVFFTAVELAVSVERVGSQPTAPASAFVYRGLCGKLWRVPPAS